MEILQQASQGKISKELINRLMSILGHLIQLRTLKVSQFASDKDMTIVTSCPTLWSHFLPTYDFMKLGADLDDNHDCQLKLQCEGK